MIKSNLKLGYQLFTYHRNVPVQQIMTTHPMYQEIVFHIQ